MDPRKRAEDLHDAVTFLSSNPLVDPNKVALWGLCFDGNISLAATALEYVTFHSVSSQLISIC